MRGKQAPSWPFSPGGLTAHPSNLEDGLEPSRGCQPSRVSGDHAKGPAEQGLGMPGSSAGRSVANPEAALLWQAVREHGWPTGLELFASRLPESRARAIRSELMLRHTCWKGFLDPHHRNEVLVIDPGYGSVAVSLSREFARVVALYTDPDLIAAVEARVKWLGIKNIVFKLATDLLSFEFSKGSLDAVVIYGLPARALPRGFLEMCGEWLYVEGVLYIALPNNLGIRRLLRNPGDPGLLTFLKGLRPIFPSVVAFRYDGDLMRASELTPLQGPHKSLRKKIISILAPFVAPGFGVFASKTVKRRSLYDEVVRAIEKEYASKYGQTLSLVVERHLFTNLAGFTLVVQSETARKKMIVRLPFDDLALKRYERNYSMLQTLAALPTAGGGCFPRAVLSGAVMGQEFFVESFIEGASVNRRLLVRPNRYAEVISGAISWITQLHVASARPQVFDDSLVHELIVVPLTRAFSLLSTQSWGDESGLIKEFLVRSFRGRKIKLVFSHGDYSVDNVLFDARTGKVRGAFDWDLAEERGLPLLDVFYFLFTAERMRRMSTPGAIFGEKLFPLRLTSAERSALEGYRQALQVPEDLVFPLALMTWVDHVARRLYRPEFYHFPHWSADHAGTSLKTAADLIRART